MRCGWSTIIGLGKLGVGVGVGIGLGVGIGVGVRIRHGHTKMLISLLIFKI